MSINKLQFIELLGARLGVTRTESESFINNFIQIIYKTLNAGDDMNISGFGKFTTAHFKKRVGINPQSKKKLIILNHNTPKFRAGSAFKEAINFARMKPPFKT